MSPFGPFGVAGGRPLPVGVISAGGGGSFVERATDPPDITHWWDPKDGSDSNSGLSSGSAFLTFQHAVDETISAGGVLGIVDNTYTSADPGLASTSYLASYQDVAPASRLWIRADTERQAIFETGGAGLFYLDGAENLTLWGITAKSADDNSKTGSGAVLWAANSTDIHVIRMLISKVNNGVDQKGMLWNIATRPYMEECEIYDFYRHAYSLQRSERPHLRRCYANARMATATNDNPTHTSNESFMEGISAYRSNNGLFENCIMEGGADYRIQSDYIDGEQKSYNQLAVGCILNGGRDVHPSDFRRAGTHYQNLAKHWLILDTTENGLDISTDFHRFENVTIANVNAGSRTAIKVEEFNHDGTEATSYETLTGELPATSRARVKNSNIFSNGNGAYREEASGIERELSYCNLYGNGGAVSGSSPVSQNLTDASLVANVFTNSQSTDPSTGIYGLDFAGGETVIYIPSGHPLENQGDGTGIDGHIGCTILHRYEGSTNAGALPDETLTSTPLWNPSTGAFPHGAVIAGYNDQDSTGTYNRNRSLSTLHTRLGISSSTLPSGYGS